MIKKLFFFYLSVSSLTFSQNVDDDNLFSRAIEKNMKKYISLSNKLYNKKNYEKAQYLFDSLVNHNLTKTSFDDFSFKRFGKRRIKISDVKKPIILITYSSWCIMGKGEIPALNQLAKDYEDKVQIMVLFWNKKSDMKHIAKKFDKNVIVCYANENERKDSPIMMYMKRPLGFPTAYLINENKMLVDIKKSFVKPENKIDLQRSAEHFYKKYSQELSLMIVTDKFNTSKYASF